MILTSMHLLYKKQGETCLEALQRLKNELQTSDPMTYAGRLDPLAAGLLIVLQGQDEIAGKAAYLDLPKTYEFEVVFGVSTDTFDQLGIIVPSTEVLAWPTLCFDQESRCDIFPSLSPRSAYADPDNSSGIAQTKMPHLDLEQIRNFDFKKLIGKAKQTYPFYSSKPIDGIPLFQYVKDHGIAATIPKLPTNEVEIFDIEVLGEGFVISRGLAEESMHFAKNIKGDFRQDEIMKSWKEFDESEFTKAGESGSLLDSMRFRMTVSSGFYIRSFACWLGQAAVVGAIARNIVRTRVGDLGLS